MRQVKGLAAKILSAAALLMILLVSFRATPAGAGTTGSLSGTLIDTATGAPVTGATVTVASPSQVESTSTDARGHFTFISLAPDTYALSAKKNGYDNLALPGVTVVADAQKTLALRVAKALRTIANVTARSTSALVSPGTTADVYSVNAQQQARLSALGGGGDLNSAFSAVASVPGAYVPTNQSGYLQAVHVRGGDAYEVGYELDGVPINRSFDNYPSSSLSSLGQQELQVYTGATPANGEAQGLAGFVNQVIKTGTYPGFASGDFTLGTPSFYHSASVEVGGASANRLFSYYAGFNGYNKELRYVDQFDARSYSNEFGVWLGACPSPAPDAGIFASCYTNGRPNISGYSGGAAVPGDLLGPVPYGNNVANLATRTGIVNLHFGIPHRHDSGRDDIQLLYDNENISSALYNSAQDLGKATNPSDPLYAAYYNSFLPPYYSDYYQYTGLLGQTLPANYASLVKPYLFPSSPRDRAFGSAIPLDQRDVQYNNQAIVKLQYQKNFGSDSFLRIYGYTYYSDYIGTGPVSTYEFTGFDSGDYELNAHTLGLSATFAQQLGRHLLQAQASYTTANAIRVYNEQPFGAFGGNPEDNFAVLVNPKDLTSGTCYAAGASPGAATPTSCSNGSATFASLAGIGSGMTLPPNASAYTCGGVACAFYVVGNGAYGEYNNVKPYFTGLSLTDQYHPDDRVSLNVGIRLDSYRFAGDNTNTGAARTFWFNAFNHDTCYNTQSFSLSDKTSLSNASSGNPLQIGEPCSNAGGAYAAAQLANTVPTYRYNVLQPRIGATYTLSPDTVLRASWGEYNEQPTSAYEQYDALQANLPALLSGFYSLGFRSPGHNVAPPISYNTDFSIEHHVRGTSLTTKITPFLRQTHSEVENFYTNTKAGIVSGLNAGNQTSEGFEFALNGGDFGRNGLAGQLSFAYTNSYVKYSTLPNGQNVLAPINNDIQTYNAYTSYCAAHPSSSPSAPCYTGIGTAAHTSSGVASAACYTPAGAADTSCAAGDIGNPYWNAPPQGLIDPGGKYLPYSVIPGGLGSGVNAYNYPYVATLVLNYKHDRFALTPSLQFVAGNRYGAPETTPGIDPALGCGTLGAQGARDPRYPYGVPRGGLPYDASTCAGSLVIPDPYTGRFDALGAFREPSQLIGHLRISYDLSPKATLTLTLANLINTCFGGQQTGFTYLSNSNVCSYGNLVSFLNPIGNMYNPGDNVQTFLRYPYEPYFGTYNDQTSSLNTPFSAYLSLQLKL
ncbi:MAG: TonB-dependent receptor [Candidatus Eremiobacteraeota bacterium]|nr:TonB-dependent receptor [Candidatus Eremiobacteraeota bacterium]